MQQPPNGLERFYGIYRGFSPTDESPIGMGELEVSFTETEVKCRMATGLELQEESLALSELRPMSGDEVKEIFAEGSEYASKFVGFEAHGIKYLFLSSSGEDNCGLIVRGTLGDILGSTFLYNPEQVARGLYQQTADAIEKRLGKGCFPTLETGGKCPEYVK